MYPECRGYARLRRCYPIPGGVCARRRSDVCWAVYRGRAVTMAVGMKRAQEIATSVEKFVRDIVIPYEKDPRRTAHGPADELVWELREKARAAGVLTPHILPAGTHLSQRETALVLRKSGLSPLGPLAVNTAAPDEGNMYLLGRLGSTQQQERFLKPLVAGARSAFFMTEPWQEGGAGSDPALPRGTADV